MFIAIAIAIAKSRTAFINNILGESFKNFSKGSKNDKVMCYLSHLQGRRLDHIIIQEDI